MEPFLLARNPDPDSSLPFLVKVPIEGAIVLETRESWQVRYPEVPSPVQKKVGTLVRDPREIE